MQKITFIDIKTLTPIFNAEESAQFCLVLNKQFSGFLNHEHFEMESGFLNDQIQIKLTLLSEDASFAYPIEVIVIQENDTEPRDIVIDVISYLEMYFSEFFAENRNFYLPLDWSVHTCEDLTLFMRGFIRNFKVEKSADEFLAQHGHGDLDIKPISSEY